MVQIDTNPDNVETREMVYWGGDKVSPDEYDAMLEDLVSSHETFGINTTSSNSKSYAAITDSISGIFGIPYQFSENVDPRIEKNKSTSGNNKKNSDLTNIGRKYSEKILSVMPVLFLTPGEPLFMAGYGRGAKEQIAQRIMNVGALADGDPTSDSEIDEGRYYSFTSNFPEYRKYANTALRALALYMGIEDVEIPIPGKESATVTLSNIDIEKFMNNSFTKLFGTQCTVPFFLDAETAISESFSNEATESMIAQTANQFSSTAREIQFILGSKDEGGLVKSIGNTVGDLGQNVASAMGDLADGLMGKNLISRVANELTTIVSGGKIVFPQIWGGSSYSRDYTISIKLRSPDPDPVSIFLNIYLPIILLVSMTAPRQIGNSSNSYESPFLVRASYKSIFSCDLGLISSLSIQKGGPDKWNVMGQPVTAEVSLQITDLYQDFFISKRMGLITNTAQMDYLANMAGVDLNEFEPTRIVKLWKIIMKDTVRDFTSDLWGNVKRTLNQKAANVLSMFSDTRFLQ